MRARVDQLHGGPAGGAGASCPGDGDEEAGVAPCRRFQSTYDSAITWEQRLEQLATCETCGGKGPVADDGAAPPGEKDEEIVTRVERFVAERDSCRAPLDLAEVTPLELELIVYWDACVAAHERAHHARVAAMSQVIASLVKAFGK